MNRDNKTLVTVFVAIIIILVVISLNTGSIMNPALSKSSSQNYKKPSSLNPSPLPNLGSNQYSTHLSFAHLPPTPAHSLRANPTNAASNTTNKIVILTFGDTKKSQFTIAKGLMLSIYLAEIRSTLPLPGSTKTIS